MRPQGKGLLKWAVTHAQATRATARGFATSEFWLAAAAVAAPALVSAFGTGAQQPALASGWIGGLVAAVYAAARSYLKANAVKSATVESALAAPHAVEHTCSCCRALEGVEATALGLHQLVTRSRTEEGGHALADIAPQLARIIALVGQARTRR